MASDAARNTVNSFSYVLTSVSMPIINAIGGEDVSWAKVYTFDENWSYQGRDLDDGTLSEDQLKETIHSTVGVLTSLAPSTKILKTANPMLNKAGDYVINTTAKSLVKKSVDYSIGYKQKP
jgi:hypothetical protein